MATAEGSSSTLFAPKQQAWLCEVFGPAHWQPPMEKDVGDRDTGNTNTTLPSVPNTGEGGISSLRTSLPGVGWLALLLLTTISCCSYQHVYLAYHAAIHQRTYLDLYTRAPAPEEVNHVILVYLLWPGAVQQHVTGGRVTGTHESHVKSRDQHLRSMGVT